MSVSYRQLISNISGLLGVKLVTMIASLAIIPSYIVFFAGDTEAVGLWLSIWTGLIVISTFDFGIGNRLKNDLIGSYAGRDDSDELIARSVFASLTLSLFVLFVAGLAIVVSYFLFDIPGVHLVISEPFLIALVILYVASSIPLRLMVPILQSQQRNALSGVLLALPQISLFLYVSVFSNPVFNSQFYDLLVVFTTVTLATYLYFAIKVLGTRFLYTLWSLRKQFSLKPMMATWRAGYSFFAVQASMIFLFNSNELFYYFAGDVEQVLTYQYYYRVFSLVFVSFSIASLPFWSAIRHYYVSEDFGRVKSLSLMLLLLLLVTLLFCLAIAYFFSNIIELWLGAGTHSVDNQYLTLFVLFSFCMCLMYSCSALLNSLDLIRYQSRVLIAACIAKSIMLFTFATFQLGYDNVLLSTVLSLFFVVTLLTGRAAIAWRAL